MKGKKDNKVKAGERHDLLSQIGKTVNLTFTDSKTEHYGTLRSVDDFGMVLEYDDKVAVEYDLFLWDKISRIRWKREKL